MLKKNVALTLACLMIAGSACALCTRTGTDSSCTLDYHNCAMECGLFGIFARQDYWTERFVYNCQEGYQDTVTKYRCHNGECC